MNKLTNNLFKVFLILFGMAVIFSLLSGSTVKSQRISFSELVQKIQKDEVQKIQLHQNNIAVILKDNSKLETQKEPESSLVEILRNYGVPEEKISNLNIEIKNDSGWSVFWNLILPILLPFILLFVFFWFMTRRAEKGAMQVFSFSRANIRLFSPNKDRITFDDVAGLKEAKEELKEIVEFLKNPKKFLDIGAKIPRGVLLMGPPGSGKTLLARAVAGEANVPFFHISGSEFVEMFVGVGASVTGDTPILIKTPEGTKLLPIKEFVDRYYKENESGFVKPVNNVQTLGFRPLTTKFYGAKSDKKKFFGGSGWTNIQSVFRHKVNEIYEIYYHGGLIKTTGNHSIFVRNSNMIKAKKASELKPGDILVNLPFKVRSKFIPGLGTTHKIRAHQFPERVNLELDLFDNRLGGEEWKYNFALERQFVLSQAAIGKEIGVSQATVKNWQLNYHQPRFFSANVFSSGTSPRIQVTPKLMRLLGYYTAEGRTTKYYTQFTFGLHEKELHSDCAQLLKEIFNIEPAIKEIPETNSLRITLSSPIIADFFQKHCGNGSHYKHLPPFIWELPREHFLAYLGGYSEGDGYTTREDKLVITSVSQQLIRELAWLCSMHGLQVGVGRTISPVGRIIYKNPLPETKSYRLTISKTSHPFKEKDKSPYQWKKPIITKIIRKSYNDYVYDLCGCENEAFFGGEKPILLHNSRVRDLFQTAKKTAPAIIFIDEIDAVGRERGAGLGGGHDEREQTLNQILVEMDGFDRDTRVIVMAATNRPDILDVALLRPGRFDRRVVLDLPDINERTDILKIHSRGKQFDQKTDLRRIAERTPGFSGADLANLINEAAILAAQRNKKTISQQELLESIEKVVLGPERKSHILNQKEKEITAYHEAGHALVASSLPHCDPVQKVSIIARGRAAGYTLKLPTEDRHLKTRSEFLDDLAAALGGYAAEEIVFNEVSTGAAADLKESSDIARTLVTKYGMSKKLGPITFGKSDELVFLGREIATEKNYSEKIATQIDEEVIKIMKDSYNKAKKILIQKRTKLDKIAKTLIEKETLEQEEFKQLMAEK